MLLLFLVCAIPAANAFWPHANFHLMSSPFEQPPGSKEERAIASTSMMTPTQTVDTVVKMSSELVSMGNRLRCHTRWPWDQAIEADQDFQRRAVREFCADFGHQAVGSLSEDITALYRDEEVRFYLISVRWRPNCIGDRQKIDPSKCYELLTKTWDCEAASSS